VKTRIATLLVAAIGVTLLTGSYASAGAERSAATNTVVGVAAGDKRFTTLVALVKQAGLAKTLSGKGPFTVFAPTNAAFAGLKRSAPDTYRAVTTDKALLAKVLTYHVLASRVPSSTAVAAAKKKAAVRTVQGERIKLSLRSGKLFLNGSSRVIVADVKASNGVIHAINAVIVPPSLS
jgi:uncharacterized surface protein with fasciclin (FAS1) repeats